MKRRLYAVEDEDGRPVRTAHGSLWLTTSPEEAAEMVEERREFAPEVRWQIVSVSTGGKP